MRQSPGFPGIVSHVKVLSDKVEDVSSLGALKETFIQDSMSQRQKALAIWRSVVKFRHQAAPPLEFLSSQRDVPDPIKAFNVYGYGQCCCAASHIEALARYVGLEARGWGLHGHSVPEVKIDGHWSMLDASLINYFLNADGSIASVEEIHKGIADWIAQHPQARGLAAPQMLHPFMHHGQWRHGPAILASSEFLDEAGFLPALTYSWADAMAEFGSDENFLFEYGVALGYQVNIQLRRGERLVRNWGNRGLHVNQFEGRASNMTANAPQLHPGDMGYAIAFGDFTAGRLGNGTLQYEVPLAGGVYRGGMLEVENLADGPNPAIAVADPAAPGRLVFRMPSSYVYLSGELNFHAVLGAGGAIAVSFSDNHGLDWTPLANITASGEQKLDLTPLVARRYDYRLRFEFKGKGTGLNALCVVHDIQHSQRALPILDRGDNIIRFSACVQEGTITLEGRMNEKDAKSPGKKNLVISDFHPVLENLAAPSWTVQGQRGTASIPIATPGDMTRLRVGIHCRARKAEDAWTISASFDGGVRFIPVAAIHGPYKAISQYFVFDSIPPGTRKALVRFTGTQHLTAEEENQRRAGIDEAQESRLLDLRIDADYQEPHGGFAPVEIIYAYTENGVDKTDVHAAKNGEDAYTIHCDEKPVMKSISLKLAGE